MTETPTNHEQLMLELVNRTRMDPAGEYDRLIQNNAGVTSGIESAIDYFGVDLTALASQFAEMEAVAPLAWNEDLAEAANGHTALLIQNDSQSHQEPGELSLGARIEAAGYDYQTVGENVYSYTDDMFYGHAGFMIDWGYDAVDIVGGVVVDNFDELGDGIQDGAGHRVNIMNGNFTEIGMGITPEDNPATDVGPFVVTQNLGTRFDSPTYLLGVVIEDQDDDAFYDIGEGIEGATITAVNGGSQVVTTSWASGGYQMELTAGTWTVTIVGTDFAAPITETVTIGSDNVKLDALVTISERAGPDHGHRGR